MPQRLSRCKKFYVSWLSSFFSEYCKPLQSCVKEKAFHHQQILFDVFAAADDADDTAVDAAVDDVADAAAVVVVVVVTSLLFNC